MNFVCPYCDNTERTRVSAAFHVCDKERWQAKMDMLLAQLDDKPVPVQIAEMNTALEEYLQNSKLIALAQSAPHDCGDPECPGVINKRKLELYDKFQTVINEFAKAGLLT